MKNSNGVNSSSSSSNNGTQFIVMSAKARMPSRCWGRYMRVAVLEVAAGAMPKMISSRARGVVRVVRTWEKCNSGATEQCAYMKAYREAEKMAEELNRAR